MNNMSLIKILLGKRKYSSKKTNFSEKKSSNFFILVFTVQFVFLVAKLLYISLSQSVLRNDLMKMRFFLAVIEDNKLKVFINTTVGINDETLHYLHGPSFYQKCFKMHK